MGFGAIGDIPSSQVPDLKMIKTGVSPPVVWGLDRR